MGQDHTEQPALVPISNQDSLWLHAGSEENLMIVNCLLFFKGKLDLHRLRELVETSLYLPRFRSTCVLDPSGRDCWKLALDFDVRLHCYRLALPSPGSDRELEEVVGCLISKPLDQSKPLWESIILEGYQGGGSCLLMRIHHVLGDGISLGKLFFERLTTHDELSLQEHLHHHHKKPAQSRWYSPMNLLFRPLATVSRLISIPEQLLEGAKTMANTIDKFSHMPFDRNMFKPEKLGRLKRVAWSREFELTEIGEVRRRFGVTVNDLLLAVICSALREFALANQSEMHSVEDEVKATLPVNLAPPDNEEVGNQFAVVIIKMPISLEDPLERLQTIKRTMDRIKHSLEPNLTFGTAEAISMLPLHLGDAARTFFVNKMSMVISNVPGPPIPVKVAGETVERMLFFLPASGNLAMTFSIFGYNQKISIGVVTDEHNLASSSTLVGLIEKAFQDYANLLTPESSYESSSADNSSAH